jgi:hypothetical protein
MATGSGKTLGDARQHPAVPALPGQARPRRELNRIILLTPNEGLSQQHLREFQAAGIEAELFNKDGRGLFAGQAVEILEVTKLRDEMGDKTVAIDAFEGNNLVLVDEGHRGASAASDGRLDALPQRAVREGLLVRVLGHIRAGGEGQRRSSPICTPRTRCSTTRTATSTATASARTTRS